jgi:hypothetical protein
LGGTVAFVRDMRNAYKIKVGNPKWNNHFRDRSDEMENIINEAIVRGLECTGILSIYGIF